MRWLGIWLVACSTTVQEGNEIEVSVRVADAPVMAALTVSAAELMPCGAARHSAGSALRVGEPHVVAADAVTLGHFTPPPGSYCKLVLTLSPADADAVGLIEEGVTLIWGDARSMATLAVELPLTLSLTTARQDTLAVVFDASGWDGDVTRAQTSGRIE